MTSIVPSPPYSETRLRQIFPPTLELQQVQIFFRHGERTPISTAFTHLGLPSYWPSCRVSQLLSNPVWTGPASQTPTFMPWKRRLETIRPDGGPMGPTTDPTAEDAICGIGDLTDTGHHSMLNLGQRLRHLYVEQLKFMPNTISDQDSLYIRASPYPRALASTHQVSLGLYPLQARQNGYIPRIVIRSRKDETLMPNEEYCLRFIQMMKAYSQKAADTWNDTEEMNFLNKMLRQHMPSQQKIAVDSTPRISEIYDTVNATLAEKNPSIRLPAEFYQPMVRTTLDRIAYDEEWSPWNVNKEYRTLGIGALLGDIVERMTQSVEAKQSKTSTTEPKSAIRMAISGGHDSTVIGILGSLGALETDDSVWPSYGANVAVELFRKPDHAENGSSLSSSSTSLAATDPPIGRLQSSGLSPSQKKSMEGYFVRIRFNDRPVTVPGCKQVGKHLDGDESFCTLTAFKEIVDQITPRDWRKSCLSNLDKPSIPAFPEPAGFS